MRKRPAAVLLALVAASALDAQTFQDSVRLDVVTVDVIATDRDGEIVRDLRREELILRIDGLPVPVDSFQPLRTQTVDLALSSAGSPGPGSKDLSAPAAAPESDHLAILIDETSMSPLSRHDMYRQLLRFIDSDVAEQIRIQIERFDGDYFVVCPWSSDTARLHSSVKALTRRSVFHRVPSPNEPRDPLDHFYDVAWYERRSIEALLFAVDRLARQPGRKALLFVTDGGPLYRKLPSAPESVFCRFPPRWGRDWEEQRRRLEPRDDRDPLQEVTRRAARNGIALLPVNSDPYLAGGWGLAVRAGLNQTMVRLADMTGGDAVLLGGYLAKRLPVFLQRRADAHVLTFRDPFAGDGDYHRIELRATRPGIRLSYRAGYQAVEER